MKTKRFWLLFLVVALLMAMAAPTASAQAEAERSEILKIAISGPIQDPTNFNMTNWSADRARTGLHQVAYEYFFYNNLQTGEFIPWLAETYEYNADSTSLTVKLRDGVTWNDGEPFTPEDVVFTYDLLRENPSMSWAVEATTAVESVEKVDALTVQFNLTEANPRYHLNREAFPAVGIWGGITILPKHIWENEDPLEFKNNPPVTTGPYQLKDATQSSVVWERRDDWWATEVFGLTPAPREVHFLHLGAETNVALALVNDEIDTSNIGILSAGSFQEVARRNPNIRAWEEEAPFAWADPCPRSLMVQNATPGLDKPEVRRALSFLIDREAIVDLAYEGSTVPAWGIWPEYDANQPYFEAIGDLREQYPTDVYDPDMAEELFTEAGVSPEDLSLRFLVNADGNEDMKVTTVVADQLTAAGLEIEIQPLSGSALADAIRQGDYDLKFHSFCPGYIVENLDLFHSKNYVPLGEMAPWYERNSFRYQNPAFDAVVDQMYQVSPDDTDALTPLFHEAMEIWLADMPVVPLVQAPALVPFNSTYWTGWPTAEDPWNMPVSWWATFNLVINGYPDPETGELVGGIEPAT
ncbi:MAG: ABC transporter substrate-binding protein [Chloroflexota bacterium]|nr:ABC transporter substrate-binding protein [Chloroflexota bacterium]